MRVTLLLVCVVGCTIVQGQGVFLSVSDYRLFVDSSASKTITDILSADPSIFQSGDRLSSNYPVWLKVAAPKKFLNTQICINANVDGLVTAFIIDHARVLEFSNGRYLKPSLRSVPENFRFVCFNLPDTASTFYLRISPLPGDHETIAIEVKDQMAVTSFIKKNIRLTFLISGGLLVVVLCAFTLFLFLHDLSHLWFCVYMIFAYVMSNIGLVGYLLGDYFQILLDPDFTQIFFVLCPVALLWLCVTFFHILTRSKYWSLIFVSLVILSLPCLLTIRYLPSFSSDVILIYNISTILLVTGYAGIRFFVDRYIPASYFFFGLLVPLVVAGFIVLDYFRIVPLNYLNVFSGLALLVQSVILFVGVATRYQKTNEELMKQSLTRWQKEHEAILIQRENASLVSQNAIIEKQKLQLGEQARRLEEMNATKDKLLSVLSHDLRAPVSNLRAILSLLSNRQLTPDEFHTLSADLKRDVEAAFEMLEEVLQWVKSQQGGIMARPENFNLNELVREVTDLAAPVAQLKNIEFNANIPNDIMVFADRDQTHIIIRNFISNAVKFAYNDTTVIVGATVENKEAVISIIDHGAGMDAEHVWKITAGQKITSTRGTSGEKGTGLGLLLCREFIELNGGKFFLKSELTVGTTVTFTLPLP